MTIEEKLQHFYDTSVAEAQTEAENTLEAHKKSLEEMFEKHKESRKMDAEAQIKAETENACLLYTSIVNGFEAFYDFTEMTVTVGIYVFVAFQHLIQI